MQPKILSQIRVYSDGASRGNPGPAAIAIKLVGENNIVLKRVSKFLGKKTNNEAEYEALIAALELTQEFTEGSVECFLDSELVVKQLKGVYHVKNPRLEKLWLKVQDLQKHFQKVSFNHVARDEENIKEIDKLANIVLDKILH